MDLKLLRWAVITLFHCTACSVCLCMLQLGVLVVNFHLGLLYECYDQFVWFPFCLLPEIKYFIVKNGVVIDDRTV